MKLFNGQDINTMSEENQLKAIKRYKDAIEYIDTPSEAVQLASIAKDPYNIEYIENPSEKACLLAYSYDPEFISYMKNPSEKVQMHFISQLDFDPLDIVLIHNPSKNILEKIKIPLIKSLLYLVRNPMHNMPRAETILNSIDKIVDWPEIKIIKDSFKADKFIK